MACSLFHRQVILSALLFLLQKAQACPSACECYGTTVNCTGRNLVSIPTNIPSNAVTLLLGHNKISSVSTTDLSDLDELRILDLSHNELTALQHEQFVFQNSPKLEDLRLDFNKISFELDGFAEPFVGLEDSLKRLSISHNLISGTLKRYQLKYHYKLQYLDLSYNVITAIQTNAFPASLTNLNIAYNKIILWLRSLRGATGLKTLDVRGLAMTGMASSYFQYSQSLESLKISGSRLTSVFGSLLYGLEALKYVEISDSKITTLPARFFSYTPLLTVANLTNNSISSFESDVAASKLEKLILDQNVLSDFSFLTKFSTSWSTMKLLSLKSNDISTSPALAVKEFPNLETLVVAYNRISDVTPMKSSKLVTIDLSYNSIDSVKPAVFENCSALTNVDFSGNRIASLAQDFEPSSIQWSLSVNPWDCGCNLVTTYQALQSSSARFTCGQSATPATECFVCSTPSNLNGQSIANVINSVSASCGVSQ
uniref:carboxypeptidase N subunit 2-like n=1 Tax=Ciona intestinalis TaxID=7719 RepID=UPI000EF52799|nr:carboxypeptidase N subunit 2-like [Ciona intestinalis]|eukprot:XP_026694564.1 carboxypeptidase N subunit 2-like [Ciona intestinalis]